MKIFCDLDGTLIDVAPRHYMVYQEITRLFEGEPIPQITYWELKRKKKKWSEILLLSGVLVEREKEFLNLFIGKIEDLDYLVIDKLFPQSLSVLKALHASHELYLVSLRRNEVNLRKELDNLDISKYFKKILTGHSETDGYDKKIELIEPVLGSSKGVIIGDTEADILTGKELNLITVAVLSGIRDKEFLVALSPDHTIESIGQVTQLLSES